MKRSLAIAALLALAATQPANAGAWTKDQGKFYLNLNYGFISGSSIYGANFKKVPSARYTQHTLGLYGEVGILTQWLTFVIDATFFRANILSEQGKVQGIGDMRLGLWSGLLKKPFHLAVGLFVGIPTGDAKPKGNDPDTDRVAQLLPTGDNETDIEPKVSLGYSFGGWKRYPLRHFVQAELGYWIRLKNFSDCFTYKLEFGVQFPWIVANRFTLIARLHGIESFASNQAAQSNGVGLGNGVTYTAFDFEVAVRLWKGLGVGYTLGTAFRARSVVAGLSHRVSLYYDFN